jgi:hypothetical protein
VPLITYCIAISRQISCFSGSASSGAIGTTQAAARPDRVSEDDVVDPAAAVQPDAIARLEASPAQTARGIANSVVQLAVGQPSLRPGGDDRRMIGPATSVFGEEVVEVHG